MKSHRTLGACLALSFALLALLAPASQAAPLPAWALQLNRLPAAVPPASTGEFLAVATNVGAKATDSPVSLQIELPEGIEPKAVNAPANGPLSCLKVAHGIDCESTEVVRAGAVIQAAVLFDAPPAAG